MAETLTVMLNLKIYHNLKYNSVIKIQLLLFLSVAAEILNICVLLALNWRLYVEILIIKDAYVSICALRKRQICNQKLQIFEDMAPTPM